MEDLTASFRSTVYKSDDYVFEIINVALFGRGSKYTSAIILRSAEIQCFDYDHDGNYLLEEGDWHVEMVDCTAITSRDATNITNRMIARLASSHNIVDVMQSSKLVCDFSKHFTHKLCSLTTIPDISHTQAIMNEFWNLVLGLFGGHRCENYIAVTERLLSASPRMSTAKEAKEASEVGQYSTWGAYS